MNILGSFMQNPNLIKELLSEVKKNKKYSGISDEIVLNEIKSYLKLNPKINHINKQLVKEIRANLHKSYSSFQTKKKKNYEKYLEELKENLENNKSIDEITNKLLSISLSTKERLNNYQEIYKKIFSLTSTPNIIVDIASGLNPVSFPLMNLKDFNYYVYDIDINDIKFLNEYFQLMKQKGLKGKAAILDIRNKENLLKIPNSDIIFLFKIVDIIDKDNHKPSEELIKYLAPKTKFIVASFATKTLTRKKMNHPNRKWFELMLDRLGLNFEKFNTENEVFYVLKTLN